ncbi:DUF6318 family protein [Nocardioides sp. TF02-7]|uniref:DUF6318 family protein n=1 Tax=Nocardioides sp. TF02-7 TaxID=2917724 RepID=UPI001F066F03|nr:DUF6318 family protein [Nocardioides sp. TF02-7]UMG93577.1 PKD domain-containing protein [Nocardioides sp. TF02-7]
MLTLALVACDDEPEPTPEPTAPSSTAVSETSTPTEPTPTGPVEPTLPAAAEEATKAGAEAFVEYYVALINYAQKTGDVATLTDIAEPACEGCRAGTDSIAEIYRRGGRITGGAYEVRRLETSRATKESWTVIAHLRVGDQTVRGSRRSGPDLPRWTQQAAIRHLASSGPMDRFHLGDTVIASLAIVALGLVMNASSADDTDVDTQAGDGQFVTEVRHETETSDGGRFSSTSEPAGTYHQAPACEGICTGELTCPDGTFETRSWLEGPNGEVLSESYWCPTETTPVEVTTTMIANALRRVPLPPSELTIQPPGGQTLVNFRTNFFTEERTLRRTVRLLGQRVDLRIEPHSYTWHFGDGESVTTEEPGAPYPRLRITHSYLRTGDYAPSLDTTWVADFRVGGGAWRPVPGSVTIAGAPVTLEAIEARPTLVGYGG